MIDSFRLTERASLLTPIVLAAIGLLSTPQPALADEGGIGVYVPGVYGNLGMAKVPPEGFYLLDFPLFASLDTEIASRAGVIHIDIDAPLFANAIVPLWLTDKKIFGGNYGAAVGIVVAGLGVDSMVEGPGGNFFENDDSNVGFGDVYAVPLAITWHKKNTYYLVYEGINVPLGEYQVGACCNIGLNYWAFDTNFTFTYHNPKRLVEFDSNIGYMYNLENNDTNYKSGANVHWDYTIGFNLSERLQVGISGYVYKQVAGDSGSGATLGDFKGEGVGIGPSVSYVISTKRPLVLQFEWIHDVHDKNRLSGDWFVFTIVARIPPIKR